jgi:hypothetical protein
MPSNQNRIADIDTGSLLKPSDEGRQADLRSVKNLPGSLQRRYLESVTPNAGEHAPEDDAMEG